KGVANAWAIRSQLRISGRFRCHERQGPMRSLKFVGSSGFHGNVIAQALHTTVQRDHNVSSVANSIGDNERVILEITQWLAGLLLVLNEQRFGELLSQQDGSFIVKSNDDNVRINRRR